MKTLKETLFEIESLTLQANDKIIVVTDREKNKIRKRIAMLFLARNYLELNPTEESAKRQAAEVDNNLKLHKSHYNNWLNASAKRLELANPKRSYELSFSIDKKELKKWNDEVKFLDYILS